MNKKNLPKAIRPNVASDAPASVAADKATPEPGKGWAPDKEFSIMANNTNTSDAAASSPDDRHARAVKLVERFSLWSGAAGVIPMPIVDLAAVGGVQIQMLRRISQIYDVPFSANRGKSIIASLAGAMIPVSSGIGAASLIKGVPIIGTIVSAIAMPTLSAAATYAIGMTFIEHFSSGGTLLDFNAPRYGDFVKAQRMMWSSRSDPGKGALPSKT